MDSGTTDTITVECACGKKLKAPATAVGRKAKCPKCQTVLTITPPPPPEPEDDDLGALYDIAEKEAGRAAEVEQTQVFCPECKRAMAPGAVLCTNCGYNIQSGKKMGAAAPAKTKAKAAKADKSGKKKDALAPEGNFFIGLAVSFGFALGASVLWFGVAWGLGWDVFFLALVIGGAAGLGMQIGQKGYSTLGGFGAAGVTLVTILLAKVAVVLAILMPMADGGADDGDDGPDSQVVEILAQQELKAKNIDPDDSTEAQDKVAHKAAVIKAKTMSKSDKEALVAKEKDAGVREELKDYLAEDILKTAGTSEPSEAQVKAAEEQAEKKLAAMTPAQRKSELDKFEAKASAEAEKDAVPESTVDTFKHVGWLVLLMTALFGIKSAIFSIGALFLAYRTAAGSVSG